MVAAAEHLVRDHGGAVGGADDDLLERCRESGMDGHLSKPVDLAELRRVVEEMLRKGARA